MLLGKKKKDCKHIPYVKLSPTSKLIAETFYSIVYIFNKCFSE